MLTSLNTNLIRSHSGFRVKIEFNVQVKYILEKIPLCELSPSLSPTIIGQHNLDRDDYWVSKASATAYYRHMSHERWPGAGCLGNDDRPRCHYPLTRSCNLQSGDVDIVTMSHVSSWDVGADVSSIGYIIIIWWNDEPNKSWLFASPRWFCHVYSFRELQNSKYL